MSAQAMRDKRGALIVVLILLVGGSTGALAAYRMHIQQDWAENGPPIDVNVTIDWPDGVTSAWNVTLQGGNTTALGALEAAARAGNHSVRTSFFDDFGGSYVYSIDEYAADPGSDTCGWMFGVNGRDAAHRAHSAADTIWVSDGDWVAWYWACI